MRRYILLFVFVLVSLYGYTQEVRNKKIVIEESVISYTPPYTYEYTIGPNQTPYSLTKGMFKFDFVVYSQGSISTKIYVGLWDFFTIGLTEDIYGLIGSSTVSFSIPMASLKLNIINEYNGFSLSVVFDSFSYGISGYAFSPDYYSRVLYGIHIPMAFRYLSLFGRYSDLVFGIKFPLLPVGDVAIQNVSLFSSTYLRFSEYVMVSFGIDNLFISAERITNSSIFSEIKFSPVRSFSVSLILNYSFLPSFERMIKMEYVNSF